MIVPQFNILPADRSRPAAVISVRDAAGVLRAARKLNCGDVDVVLDGSYSFSVRLSGNGLWCIFQRELAKGQQGPPLFG
jgi:hypothetical protein